MKHRKKHEKHLWPGLDLENFDVIHILPQSKNVAAIIMRCRHPDREKIWCVEYLGSGYYFSTYTQMASHCAARHWA